MTVTSVLIILIVVFRCEAFTFQSSDRKLGEHR